MFTSTPLRTRIAPTPSGFLHIGNVFSFLLTWLWVQKYGGKLLLRIDDLDNERFRMAYLDDIFATLEWLGITYDEGAVSSTDFLQYHSQRYRMAMYQDFLEELLTSSSIYACQCSRKQLIHIPTRESLQVYPQYCLHRQFPLNSSTTAWRVHVPSPTNITINDVWHGIQTLPLATLMGDFVVRKKDKLPAYQVASLVDDLYYSINFVVRGMDLLPSTAAQYYLAGIAKKVDFQSITFLHHGLLIDAKGQKLSKSQAATAIREIRPTLGTPTRIYKAFAHWLGLPTQDIITLADLSYFFNAAVMPSVPLPTARTVL